MIRNKTALKGIRAFGAGMLLLLYLVSSQPVDVFHALVHEHEQIAHSAEQEQDACHRAIYHNESESGCDHKAHFTVSDKCSLCDHFVKTDHLSFIKSEAFNNADNTVQYFLHAVLLAENLSQYLPARAPPVI